MTVLDDKGRPTEVEPIPQETADPFQERLNVGAFLHAKKLEIDALYASMGDALARSYWGDTPPTVERAPYVPTMRERIRWRWRSVRQAIARAALWLLRIEARELCDCDY